MSASMQMRHVFVWKRLGSVPEVVKNWIGICYPKEKLTIYLANIMAKGDESHGKLRRAAE